MVITQPLFTCQITETEVLNICRVVKVNITDLQIFTAS